MIHQGWRAQHCAQLAQKAQDAKQADDAKMAKKATKAAKAEQDADIAVERAARAVENRIMACGRASCDEICLSQGQECGWDDCSTCPAGDIIWICHQDESKTEHEAFRKCVKTSYHFTHYTER